MIRVTARYTEVLLNLLENSQTRPLINKALSTYPVYEPTNKMTYSIIPTREEINKKILDYYKYREIGFETVGRFLDELEITMNEIMPYYVQLFKSEDIMNGISDPFGNVDITESYEQETEGKSKGSTSGKAEQNTNTNTSSDTKASSETNTNMNNNSKNVHSKTPQGQLSITAENIDSLKYADDINWNKDESKSGGNTTDNSSAKANSSSNMKGLSSGESSNETTGKTKHTLTRVGNQGVNTYAHDMKELREIFLNIVQQIINDKRLQELFMQVY